MKSLKELLIALLTALHVISPAQLPSPNTQAVNNQPKPIETEVNSDESSEINVLDKAYSDYQYRISTNSEICQNVEFERILSIMEIAFKANQDESEYNRNIEIIQNMTETLQLISKIQNDKESGYGGIEYNDIHKQFVIVVENPEEYNITNTRYIQKIGSCIELKDDFYEDFVEIIVPLVFKNTYGVSIDVMPKYLDLLLQDEDPMGIPEVREIIASQGFFIEGTDIPNINAVDNACISVSGNGISDDDINKFKDNIITQCNNITSDPNKIMDTLPYILSALTQEYPQIKIPLFSLHNEVDAKKAGKQADGHDIFHELNAAFKESIKAKPNNEEKVQGAIDILHRETFGLHSIDDFNTSRVSKATDPTATDSKATATNDTSDRVN